MRRGRVGLVSLQIAWDSIFEIRMTDTLNGWAFKYSTFYPRTRPETAEPDATFAKKSDTEYTIEGPTYPEGVAKVTEHHICHKDLRARGLDSNPEGICPQTSVG
jgi:hypothetical protein